MLQHGYILWDLYTSISMRGFESNMNSKVWLLKEYTGILLNTSLIKGVAVSI